MNVSTYKNELPKLSLSAKDLTKVVIEAVSKHDPSGFQFNSIVNYIGKTLNSKKIGFAVESNTIYEPTLERADIARIRQIIWDFIILRYLTIGDYYQDEWPHMSITQEGRIFLEYNLNINLFSTFAGGSSAANIT